MAIRCSWNFGGRWSINVATSGTAGYRLTFTVSWRFFIAVQTLDDDSSAISTKYRSAQYYKFNIA